MEVSISELLGKTLKEINGVKHHETIRFITDNAEVYEMYHQQDCCESVYVEDIVGDIQDLIGSPILEAEEVISTDIQPWEDPDVSRESFTWTFYKLGTKKGHVTIRWYGNSNGYYSERVSFVKMNSIEY